MMVKALKKKNNMSGPFKLKSGNSPLFKNLGSSPARDREDTLQESGGPPKSGDGRPKAKNAVKGENEARPKAKNADTVNAKPRKTPDPGEKKSNVAIGTEKVSSDSPGSGWTKTKGTNIWTYNG